MCRFPVHACPFEMRLHDGFVGTFHRTRTNRPSILLISRIVHQCFTLAQIGEWFFNSLNCLRGGLEARESCQQKARSSVFQQVQTAFEGIPRDGTSRLEKCINDIADPLGGMGKI
jgi:hypothetical protein